MNFVGRRWLWYAMSGLIVVLAVLGLQVRGLDPGIEFVGGAEYKVTVPAGQVTQANADKVREAVAGTGIKNAAAPTATTSGDTAIIVQTQPLSTDERAQVADAITSTLGVDRNALSQTEIVPIWGQEVAKRSATGLVVFLVLVVLFIWAYFREWKMSVAAIVALAHDVIITVGVYAWSGFEVTPATVTGVLTILGFSLYDTVVVFDKVRENTKNLRRTHQTYAEAANLAVNQTLVRSINTSLVALIPVGAILYMGVTKLGSGSLKDLALALFVGMAAGAYSSIFIATPLVAHMKGAESTIQESDRRAKARRRHQADRYAQVPVFSEDMPVYDEPGEAPSDAGRPAARRTGATVPDPGARSPEGSAGAPVVRRTPSAGRGRTPAPSQAPVEESASAGRAQPKRESRAKRAKK
ncbi:MAG: protein translocase subunit SecF [Nocardioides sp.]